MSKVVLISGASSGIGQKIAEQLHQEAYRVFGTKLPHETLDEPTPYTLLNLDVSSDDSVRACIDEVFRQAGRLDVLVNNAGFALTGAIEETSLAEAKHQLEVNFWGAVRLTQAALPHMRTQGSGYIINMSSLLGLYGTAFSGFYAASKHALEGYTKSLRYEVGPFGLKVCMIEPGFVRTDFMQHRRSAAHSIPAYSQMQSRLLEFGAKNLEQGFPPERIAETVSLILKTPQPNLSYPLFLDSFSAMSARLSEPMRERTLHMLMGVYEPNWGALPLVGLATAGLGVGAYLWLRGQQARGK
jgi:NAD(P)-dependent dehydrogenase (short-subunit alcohol dehydrogenase family)